MPEGDTVHRAARAIEAVLAGRVPDHVATPQPRHAVDRWPERLAGRAVCGVQARGKHLLVRFEGGLTLHSHLRMSGAWAVHAQGERWRRAPNRAWLVLRAGGREVVQFDGPVLELMTDARARSDRRLAELGPDVLGPDLDGAEFLRRLRADDPTRGIADALLDQRTIAGIGNMWKSEACWRARVDPFTPLRQISDQRALSVVTLVRPPMQESALTGRQDLHRNVYERAGRPCPRCREPIRARAQGEGARTTYWCPACQG